MAMQHQTGSDAYSHKAHHIWFSTKLYGLLTENNLLGKAFLLSATCDK